ncbi:MAG: polyketide biosynthesis 3-hydroxy-3-methylglutaryl-ACP synthase PksG [marine bacterium B5-7]|nr:MAG: polyketide biosynthesis 3-hydroxy-3-methylglutaryl-ACP synthase PksG [marine bacterium B5-7]
MISVGIESMNIFGGTAYINIDELSEFRQLDTTRSENLLMKEKTVSLPFEDPITFGVNAAKPIIDKLTETEKNQIGLVIACTESGIDFGKSITSYIHHYLALSKNCRFFEIKQACYSGTAGFQMAVNFILSQTAPGAKALVIATDISRFMVVEESEAINMAWSFAEPSSGAGAVALLVSDKPEIFEVDVGANGYYGHEVMDTCRPVPDSEAGDSDLSLMSYLDCCEQAFLAYKNKVRDIDYRTTFNYLAFHTPFGGMVRGAHRTIMRKMFKASADEIETDFLARVMPGLLYCQRVGNIMGGTIFLSLASTIENADFFSPMRIGLFSYGSGCCSEFYSGTVSPEGKEKLSGMQIKQGLDLRHRLSISEYEKVLQYSHCVKFGTRNVSLDREFIPGIMPDTNLSSPKLYLKEISEFHRRYVWE